MKTMRHIVTCVLALLWPSAAFTAGEPQDLTILRDSYNRAIERATSPIQEKFITEMQKLKLRYTREGKLEEAITVDREINRLLDETKAAQERQTGTETTGGTTEHLIGDWYCNNVRHDIYKIKPNKRAQHVTDSGTWKADDKELTISWANGWRTVIPIDQKGDTIHAKHYQPGASDYNLIKFTRVKDAE